MYQYRNSRRQQQQQQQCRRYDTTILLQLLRLIVQETILFQILILWNIIAMIGIIVLSHRLIQSQQEQQQQHSHTTILKLPDLYIMGYTYQQIYDDFYNVIGMDGCTIYTTLALWDIYILIPAYTLFLGAIYVYVSRHTYDTIPQMDHILTTSSISRRRSNGYWNADQRVPYLILPIAMMDIIETSIQKRGCTLLLHEQQGHSTTMISRSTTEQLISSFHLSNIQVRIASIAVSMKWSMIALFFLSILERLYHCYVCRSKNNKSKLYDRQLPLWM
jgi:hypothetical protein